MTAQPPEKNNWVAKLKSRWQISSNWQLVIILIVFAITGSTTAYVTKPIYTWLGIGSETSFLLKVVAFFVVMMPVYQVLLLLVGSVAGQFRFFWNFEKKMWSRWFKSNKNFK